MPGKLDCNSVQKKRLIPIPLKSRIIPFDNSSNIKILFKVNDLLFHFDDPEQFSLHCTYVRDTFCTMLGAHLGLPLNV